MTRSELENAVRHASDCVDMARLQAIAEIRNPIGRIRYSSYTGNPIYKGAVKNLETAQAALNAHRAG